MFDVPDEYEAYVHPEDGELPEVFFHVAHRADRATIDAEGLSVDATRTHNTGGDYGDDPDDEWLHEHDDEGNLRPVEWRPHGVYLWPTLEQALDYAGAREVDIYKIDASDIGEVIRDPSVAMNWGHQPENDAYVTDYVPGRSFERIEGPELTALLADRERINPHRFRPSLSSVTQEDHGQQLALDPNHSL